MSNLENTEFGTIASERAFADANKLGESAAARLAGDLRKNRPFASGTIIGWTSVAANGIEYEYAAVFANGRWYTTVAQDNQYVQKIMTHEQMIDYLSERGDYLANLRVAVAFERVDF